MLLICRQLEAHTCFAFVTNLADPPPLTILNAWMPRSCCVASLHCARGFVFLAAAFPSAQADGSSFSWRFFVQRRALPECLLFDDGTQPESQRNSDSTKMPPRSAAARYAYTAQVHAALEELFEAAAAEMLQCFLAAMLPLGQSSHCIESKNHLLLLPDIRLSHFPFEQSPALKRLFGYRMTRDFSLPMFARRMQYHDAASLLCQPKKTVAELHSGFAREALLLLPEACKYSNMQNSAVTEWQMAVEEHPVPSSLEAGQGVFKDKERMYFTLRGTARLRLKTFKEQATCDWRSEVLAELSTFKKASPAEGSPGVPLCISSIPELLCSKNPQAAWSLCTEKLVSKGNDLRSAVARMDLTHLSLLGLIVMKEHQTTFKSNFVAGRLTERNCFYHKKVARLSNGVETLLVFSTRGTAMPYTLLHTFFRANEKF